MRSDPDGAHVGFDPIGLKMAPGTTVRWLVEANVHTTTAYHRRTVAIRCASRSMRRLGIRITWWSRGRRSRSRSRPRVSTSTSAPRTRSPAWSVGSSSAKRAGPERAHRPRHPPRSRASRRSWPKGSSGFQERMLTSPARGIPLWAIPATSKNRGFPGDDLHSPALPRVSWAAYVPKLCLEIGCSDKLASRRVFGRSHAGRLRQGLDPGAGSRPAARCPEDGRLQQGVRGESLGRAARAAGAPGGARVHARRATPWWCGSSTAWPARSSS